MAALLPPVCIKYSEYFAFIRRRPFSSSPSSSFNEHHLVVTVAEQ
jgi:hypothetical protein